MLRQRAILTVTEWAQLAAIYFDTSRLGQELPLYMLDGTLPFTATGVSFGMSSDFVDGIEVPVADVPEPKMVWSVAICLGWPVVGLRASLKAIASPASREPGFWFCTFGDAAFVLRDIARNSFNR